MKKYLNHNFFLFYAEKLLPILYPLMFGSLFLGLYYVFLNSPQDYQQGNMIRIMYIHVPMAFLSLSLYFIASIFAFINLVWRTKIAYFLCISILPLGCCYSFLTLITGSLWGKPIWGTYWAWDARLTSMLIMFLFYLFKTAIIYSGENLLKLEKPICVLSIIGSINVPIVKFSVNLWASLHQKSSFIRSGGVAIDKSMLIPLFIMMFFFCVYSLINIITNVFNFVNLTKSSNSIFSER